MFAEEVGEKADWELVQRCRRHERDGQEAFVRRFKTGVYRWMLKLTGRPELAEDLTQETMLRALSRIESFRERKSLSGWVNQIALNLARDYFRNENVRREQSLEPALLAHMPSERRSADMDVIGDEERILVSKALMELAPKYREVILLAHFDGLALDEIAARLELGLSAVKMRLHRGRAFLLQKLETYYAER